MLVEFADLQCPHCKEVQGTMDQLVKDFPNARVVYQSFPIVTLHPVCVQGGWPMGTAFRSKKNDAYFAFYSAAVFDTQEALGPRSGRR